MLTRASLLAAQPKSKNSMMYSTKVERCAASVPLGMSYIGFLRLWELLAPLSMPVQALKKIACKVKKEYFSLLELQLSEKFWLSKPLSPFTSLNRVSLLAEEVRSPITIASMETKTKDIITNPILFTNLTPNRTKTTSMARSMNEKNLMLN